MKSRPTQFGVRENTASSRQHASRLVPSSALLKSARPSGNAPEDKQSPAQVSLRAETVHLSLGEPENGATGEARNDATGLATELNGRGGRSGIERALARGDDPEVVIQRIADYRSEDKDDPKYYARHTVMKAQAKLARQSTVDRPAERDRT